MLPGLIWYSRSGSKHRHTFLNTWRRPRPFGVMLLPQPLSCAGLGRQGIKLSTLEALATGASGGEAAPGGAAAAPAAAAAVNGNGHAPFPSATVSVQLDVDQATSDGHENGLGSGNGVAAGGATARLGAKGGDEGAAGADAGEDGAVGRAPDQKWEATWLQQVRAPPGRALLSSTCTLAAGGWLVLPCVDGCTASDSSAWLQHWCDPGVICLLRRLRATGPSLSL